MSNSEGSFDEGNYVTLSERFAPIIRPKLDTEQMHALRESVRKERVKREGINEDHDSDNFKEKSDIEKVEEESEGEESDQSEEVIENDMFELREEDNGSDDSRVLKDIDSEQSKKQIEIELEEGEQSLETCKNDMIETTEKVENKQEKKGDSEAMDITIDSENEEIDDVGSGNNDEGLNFCVDDQKSDFNEQKDEELEASDESGNRADLDTNIMEKNDNEDMRVMQWIQIALTMNSTLLMKMRSVMLLAIQK